MHQLLSILIVALALSTPAYAQEPAPEPKAKPADADAARSGWLVVPVFSSNPKLGTAGGGLLSYMHTFDPKSRVSLVGVLYEYSSTHSQIAGVFARLSLGADHHRILAIAPFGHIKNDYDDYLSTGQPLKTEDDLKAFAARYLLRTKNNWFVGAQGNAANYQVLGATPDAELVLETLGIRGFSSAALGAVLMHDSRDNEDMPSTGWFLNVNNLAYREGLGGSSSFDAYRVDGRLFWKHGSGHVLAVRQNNWASSNAPAAAQATVMLRGYKFGQYLSPYMSSLEVEERLSFNPRWGATLFVGAAGLYGDTAVPQDRSVYPTVGGGVHFVIKPAQHMIVNFEFAQGVGDSRGVYLKLGYAW